MKLTCSSQMIKYLMFAFNLFFVISGIILIAVGATVKTVYSDYSDFLDSKYFTLPNMLIATGAFIFIISFFGCCGAIKENWIMLGVFSILLCIIFIFELSAGIAGYVLRDKTMAYLDTTLKANLKNYPNETHAIWDSIQSGFQCCGVDSYLDWSATFNDTYALPVSCCPAVTGTAGAFYCNSFTTTVSSEGTTSLSSSTTNPTTPTTIVTTTPTITTTVTDETTPTTTTKDTPASTKAPTTTESSTTEKTSDERRKRDAVENEQNANSTTLPPTSPASTSGPYTIGCKTAFGHYVKKHAVQIGGCALGLAIIQILGIAFSCHLVRQLKNGYYST